MTIKLTPLIVVGPDQNPPMDSLLQVETEDDKVIIQRENGMYHLFENATIVPLVANRDHCDEMSDQYEVKDQKLGVYTLMHHRNPTPDTPSYRILFVANGIEIRFSGLLGPPSALVVPSTQCLSLVPKELFVFQNIPDLI